MRTLNLNLVGGNLPFDLASFVGVLNLNFAIPNFNFNFGFLVAILGGNTVDCSNVSNLMRLNTNGVTYGGRRE